MHVLQVIPSISAKHGGPSYAVLAIARALQANGNDVVIATTDDDGDGSRLPFPVGEPIEGEGVTHFFFRRDFLSYKVSFGLSKWLNRHIPDFDLVHIHALFSFSSTVAARSARKHGIPYIVRPLGVLNRWGMENRRRLTKAISFRLVEKRILENAAAIHYTSDAERRDAELCGEGLAKIRSAIIPLPLAARQSADNGRFFERFPALTGKRILLFLSRIHPKKGLEILLEAFTEIHKSYPDTRLVVAGDGDAEYCDGLRRRARALGIAKAITWTGHLEGAEKWAAYDAATLYVLPSYSENFGVAAAEALSSGVPSIITSGVGLAEEVEAARAAVIIKPDSKALALVIEELLQNSKERRRLGEAAKKFASERFSPASVARALESLYQEVLDRTGPVETQCQYD